MNNYIIKQIGLSEYDKCNNIWDMKKCPFTKDFIKQIKSGNREVYILTVDGEYIAECDLVYENPEYKTIPQKRIYLSRLITKKEYRGMGYGSAITQYIINIAKEKGYSEIALGVDCDNKNAIHIYEKFGFSIYEEAEDKYGKFFRMEKTDMLQFGE